MSNVSKSVKSTTALKKSAKSPAVTNEPVEQSTSSSIQPSSSSKPSSTNPAATSTTALPSTKPSATSFVPFLSKKRKERLNILEEMVRKKAKKQ